MCHGKFLLRWWVWNKVPEGSIFIVKISECPCCKDAISLQTDDCLYKLYFNLFRLSASILQSMQPAIIEFILWRKKQLSRIKVCERQHNYLTLGYHFFIASMTIHTLCDDTIKMTTVCHQKTQPGWPKSRRKTFQSFLGFSRAIK